MLKLNLWQRIGVVLSIVWLFGAGGYIFIERGQRADRVTERIRTECKRVPENISEYSSSFNCVQSKIVAYNKIIEDRIMEAIKLAILPIPVAWLVAYIILWTVRWVWRGKNP